MKKFNKPGRDGEKKNFRSRGDKSFGDKERGSDSGRKSSGGKYRKRSDDDREKSGERKFSGDRFKKRSRDESGEDRKERSGERKYSGKRFGDRDRNKDGERPARKSYGDRERRSDGDRPGRKKFGDREGNREGERSERKRFGDRDRSKYGERSDKRKFGDRDKGKDGERTERKRFGDRERGKFGERSDRKKFGDRDRNSEGEGTERKKFGDRDRSQFRERSGNRKFGEKKFFKREGGEREEGFRKNKFESRDDAERDNRFEDRRDFEKEAEDKQYRSRKKNQEDSPQGEFVRKKSFSKKSKSSSNLGETEALTRLNKYLANAGIASRREADNLIKSGAVKVNDVVVTEMGFKVKPGDKVTYGDAAVKGEKKVYILLNKPKDYITTVDDPRERHTVMELIAGACRERVYPVGRLDRNTTGVLLLTNDGELTKKLTHPKYGIKKVYKVTLNKSLKLEDFSALLEGIELEDGLMKVDDVAFPEEGRKEVGIEIHSGRNRIVRRLFEYLGYDVIKLDRVVFAGLTKKDLPRGKYRFLTQKEVGFLQMIG